jgi:hypothetical protein
MNAIGVAAVAGGLVVSLAVLGIALPWLSTHLPTWVLWAGVVVLVATSAMLTSGYWQVLIPSRRARAWREVVVDEYLSWRYPPRAYQQDRHQLPELNPIRLVQGVISIARLDSLSWLRWVRTPLIRWVVAAVVAILRWFSSDGTPQAPAEPQRSAWARHWGRTRELPPLIFTVFAVTTYFSATTLLLWHFGVIHGNVTATGAVQSFGTDSHLSADQLQSFAAAMQAATDYLW